MYSNEVSRYQGVKRECYGSWQIPYTWDGLIGSFNLTSPLGHNPKGDLRRPCDFIWLMTNWVAQPTTSITLRLYLALTQRNRVIWPITPWLYLTYGILANRSHRSRETFCGESIGLLAQKRPLRQSCDFIRLMGNKVVWTITVWLYLIYRKLAT